MRRLALKPAVCISILLGAVSSAHGAVYPVTLCSDANSGGSNGAGPGDRGDFRYALGHAPTGSRIVFPSCSLSTPCTIVLRGPLPTIEHGLIIDGGAHGAVTVDGSAANFRGIRSKGDEVRLYDLIIRNDSGQRARSVDGVHEIVGAGPVACAMRKSPRPEAPPKPAKAASIRPSIARPLNQGEPGDVMHSSFDDQIWLDNSAFENAGKSKFGQSIVRTQPPSAILQTMLILF